MPYRVRDDFRDVLLAKAESGMGYQRVRGRAGAHFLVLNAEVALEASHTGTLANEDGEWLRGAKAASGEAKHEEWLASLHELEEISMDECDVAVHGSFSSATRSSEEFIRFSAFAKDRRILPNGSVLPGTYATTRTETAIVPSGLAAVGRYALPNPAPAVHAFLLVPPAPTPIHCGTVGAKLRSGRGRS